LGGSDFDVSCEAEELSNEVACSIVFPGNPPHPALANHVSASIPCSVRHPVAKLVLLFRIYALTHGIVSLIVAIANRQRARSRFLQAFKGVIRIWADTVTMRSLVISAIVLIFFIWVCVSDGNLEVEAIRLRKEISGEVWLALSGVVLILFALILRLRPVLGTFDLVWMVGGCALLFRLFETMMGREVRFMQHA
jgi:uncharacterized membrane protein HdeD (DUF308 family)